LRAFLAALEAAGELKRVPVEVDPELEVTEIVTRVVRDEGPALLFERVAGASFPLALNLLGSPKRIAIALGEEPEAIGAALVRLVEATQPPSVRRLLRARPPVRRLLSMRARHWGRAACQEVVARSDLTPLPITKCWPLDGGRFITLGLVETADPDSGVRNLGIYRMQLFGRDATGIHWQIQKGGGFHYRVAELRGQTLPVAVVVGTDPAITLAAAAPLPEGIDELAFAGFLRGAATRLAPARTVPLEVPATAEFILEGEVRPDERRIEGPFGDHFGHYSHAAPFPVFRLRAVTHRRGAIFTASIVGKPPQEDRHMGEAVARLLSPLVRVIHREVKDLAAYFEAGFHNLLVVSVDERYAKEGMKAALGLLGTGQLSLTKCLILVDQSVPVRDFDAVLRAVRDHFEPDEDFLLIPSVPLDTLDFTSYTMNLGSKMVIDATSRRVDRILRNTTDPGAEARAPLVAPFDLERVRAVDSRILAARLVEGALLVLQVDSGIAAGGNDAGAEVLARVLESGAARTKIVAVVSEDVNLDDPVSRLWGIFTRFDAARDVRFAESALRHAWPVHRGPLGIDATWKRGYPAPVGMPDDVVRKVSARWSEYRISK
jgi:4-hydroxy-3-polyprenylbenzoate decarboxylase